MKTHIFVMKYENKCLILPCLFLIKIETKNRKTINPIYTLNKLINLNYFTQHDD
jgi:hypothetical protein